MKRCYNLLKHEKHRKIGFKKNTIFLMITRAQKKEMTMNGTLDLPYVFIA